MSATSAPVTTTDEAAQALEDLERAAEDIQRQHEALTATFTQLGAALSGAAGDGSDGDDAVGEDGDGEAGDDVEAALTELAASVESAREALESTLFEALDELSTFAEDIETELAAVESTWDGLVQEAAADADALAASQQAAFQRLEARLDVADQALEQLQHQIAEAATAYQQTADEWRGRLEGEYAEDLQEGSTTLVTTVADQHQAGAQETLQNLQHILLDLTDTLGQSAQQVGQDYQEQAADALEELGRAVADDMREQLREAARRVIEEAVREVIRTAAKMVIRSELGGTVTSAMSPYLPEMMALNKILGLLREAIHRWKDLMSAGGLLG
jgi:DNA repair exonuclease SbcCD ATPase subunit